MLLLLFVLGIMVGVSTLFLLFAWGMRKLGNAGVKIHHLRDDGRNIDPRLPRCACYDTDGGPYGVPHWVNGRTCEMYFINYGKWPEWCRGPQV
jgi:hypothetical protein